MYRSILNSKKIKYNILKELVQPYLNDVDEISCFLSLNSVLKTFYSLKPDQVAESLDVSPQNALSSEIINIIAHYRHFFWSRYGILVIIIYTIQMKCAITVLVSILITKKIIMKNVWE